LIDMKKELTIDMIDLKKIRADLKEVRKNMKFDKGACVHGIPMAFKVLLDSGAIIIYV